METNPSEQSGSYLPGPASQNTSVLSHSPGGWTSKIKEQSLFLEASLLGLQMAFSCCVLMWLFVCGCRARLMLSLPHGMGQSHIDVSRSYFFIALPMSSYNFNDPSIGPISGYNHAVH
jgi:hypothetical protein